MGLELTHDKERRNELCSCESGLKFKRCHGDPRKLAVTTHVANETMLIMIAHEKRKRGKIDDEEYEKVVNNPEFVLLKFYDQFIFNVSLE